MLSSVEGGGEGGGDGRGRTVGEPRQAKPDDEKRKGADADRKEGHACRKNGQCACRDHREFPSHRIKDGAGQDTSESVTDSKDTDERGGKRGARIERQRKVAGKADDRASNRRQANECEEGAPEGKAAHHLAGTEVARLKVLALGGDLFLRLGENGVGGRRADEKRRHRQSDEQSRADGDKSSLKAEPSVKKRIGEIPEQKRAQSEAHHQGARGEPLSVGEPRVDARDDDDIRHSDSKPSHQCVGQVKEDRSARANERRKGKAKPRKGCRHKKGGAHSDAACKTACKEAADAKAAHRQGEVQRQLGRGKAIELGKGSL